MTHIMGFFFCLNQQSLNWDFGFGVWILLLAIDHYFQRISPVWTILAIHSLIWSYFFVSIMRQINITFLPPPPQSVMSKIWPDKLSRLFSDISIEEIRDYGIAFVIWHLVFFTIDYLIGICIEWFIFPILFVSLNYYDWPGIRRILAYLAASYGLTYILPAWFITFITPTTFLWVLMTFYAKIYHDIENPVQFNDYFLNVPPFYWLLMAFLIYRDVFWRNNPSTFLTFGVFTTIILINSWPATFDMFVEEARKKKHEDAQNATNENQNQGQNQGQNQDQNQIGEQRNPNENDFENKYDQIPLDNKSEDVTIGTNFENSSLMQVD